MTRADGPPANAPWSDLLGRITAQSSVLLLLDFDGTLSEIVARPEDARLRVGNSALLDALARRPGYTVGILSGRSMADVAGRVGIPGLIYAGNHGLEISGPDIDYLHPAAASAVPVIAAAAEDLAAALSGVPGAQIERKHLTLTVHFRQTPEELQRDVATLFHDVVNPLVDGGLCRVTTAKAALELRPNVDWNKGRALQLVRSRLAPDSMPVYFGDDATDEDAFVAAQTAGGAGVFVGPSGAATHARYRVDSPESVTNALTQLAVA